MTDYNQCNTCSNKDNEEERHNKINEDYWRDDVSIRSSESEGAENPTEPYTPSRMDLEYWFLS